MSAPGTEPIPPITTTAKLITTTSIANPGDTDIVGAIYAPPRAPSIPPIIKVIK